MIDLILAAPDRADEAELVAAAPLAGVRVVRRPVDAVDLLAAAAAEPSLAVVVTAGLARLSAELVSRLGHGGRLVVALPAAVEDERILRAWGITAFAVTGDDALATMQSIAGLLAPVHVPPVEPSARPLAAGSVVSVWGGAGAPGRSTTALALATASADAGSRTCLIDADTRAPALRAHVGILDDGGGLAVACRQAELGALSARTLEGACRAIAPGVAFLGGLSQAGRWAEVRRGSFAAVLGAARAGFDLVVVDVASSLEREVDAGVGPLTICRDDAAITAVEHSDLVLVVTRASTLGVLRTLSAWPDLAECAPQVPVVHVITAHHARAAREAESALREHGLAGPFVRLLRDPRAIEQQVRAGSVAGSGGRRERAQARSLATEVRHACA